ncbi:iron chelate uptake ABC transporter family permease subunit [Microbacterium sp. A93]|uniref:iron chelate uptake ABC transporter family permease subunit n=1 Tax=unclassified Microbacterium TaxID=2609290 RepID=UPI003F41CE90
MLRALRGTTPLHRPPAERRAGPLPHGRARRKYFTVLTILIVLAVAFGIGILVWDNPVPFGTDGFWRITQMRGTSIVVMIIVAFCQAIATVSFQTVTENRIITPSLMGFEALFIAVQTAAVYFLGISGLVALQGNLQFVLQIALMVGLSVLLYGWLLSGRYANLQVMLLVGIIIGGGLGSVSAFMQRLLTPSEFDVLTAQMFGSISNADPEQLPIAIPLCLVAGILLWTNARRLNLLALGKDIAMNLGLNHRRELIRTLLLVSILMAVSTALVGPMTFLGFLVATLAYQFADTYDHRYIFPISVLIGFVVLAGATFVMKNLFYAQGVVSIIIEFVGGILFLIVILRKGRL